jgi:hypothetical protein
MKTIANLTLAGLCLVGLATAPAQARINKRQSNQQARIAGGISNGSITAKEAEHLEHQQAHIERYEAKSRADGGGLSHAERERLENMQDRASRNIRHQKHDKQRR